MLFSFLSAVAFAVSVKAQQLPPGGSVYVTPHDAYSSSIGVLGCHINTNRVAYWPAYPDCTNLCVNLTYQGRSLTVLHIDRSMGAHDISYDAWNYLGFGVNATTSPQVGGGLQMDYQVVPMDQCRDLIYTPENKLPLGAAISTGYYSSCAAKTDSWVAQNSRLYNIQNPICTLGLDEVCTWDTKDPRANAPTCPHLLGDVTPITDMGVYDIKFITGQVIKAV